MKIEKIAVQRLADLDKVKLISHEEMLRKFDDEADYHLAVKVLEGIENGDRTYTLEEIKKECGFEDEE